MLSWEGKLNEPWVSASPANTVTMTYDAAGRETLSQPRSEPRRPDVVHLRVRDELTNLTHSGSGVTAKAVGFVYDNATFRESEGNAYRS